MYKSQAWDFLGGPVVKTSPSNAGGTGSIPGQGAGIPHSSQSKNKNIKQKQHCNTFNKDFKTAPHQIHKNPFLKRNDLHQYNGLFYTIIPPGWIHNS